MLYHALIIFGALMGILDTFLVMVKFNAFTFGVISGRSCVGIVLVVFGQFGAVLFLLT